MTTLKDIIRTYLYFTVTALAVLVLGACGALSDGSGSDAVSSSDGKDQAIGAAASLFSGSGVDASISKLKVSSHVLNKAAQKALDDYQGPDCGEDDPACTCTHTAQGDSDEQILTTTSGDPGTYGAEGSALAVSENDFCTQPDGTANTGLGPDGLGRLATFEIAASVEGSCQNEDGSETTIAILPESFGVWRNTNEELTGVAYEPQVFGTFYFLIQNDNQYEVDCTFYLDSDETVAFASCTDENGDTVEQDEDSSCQFQSEENSSDEQEGEWEESGDHE